MKSLLIAAAVLTLSTQAFATEKICFGSAKSEDTKGLVMSVEIHSDQIVMKSISGQAYDGIYPARAGIVRAQSGKVLVKFEGETGDQTDIILVEEALMKPGTTGLLQIRSRGEGFYNSVYICRDAK